MINFNKLLLKIGLRRLDIDRDAFEAYFHKLPEKIQVSWLKDGKFIVGRIKAEEKEFMTQGYNVEEFIEMVNDAVIAVYDIPEDYIDVLRSSKKTYSPNPEQRKLLEDANVRSGNFGSKKEKVLQLA